MSRPCSRTGSFLIAFLILAGWGSATWFGFAWWKAHQQLLKQASQPVPPVVALEVPLESGPSLLPPEPIPVPSPVVTLPVAPTVETPKQEAPAERVFRKWSADPALAGALIGFCLLDEKGQELYASPLAKTALCPASALKTVTTGAAFGLLGPEFRFETSLAANADLTKDGTIQGDLVLVGGGDPTLSVEELEALADALVAKGVKKITGQLRVDASVFPVNPMSDHWNWGDIGNAYGAGAFGVNLDHNRLVLQFNAADEEGKPANLVQGEGLHALLRFENHIVTGPEGSGDQVVGYSQPYDRRITLRGSVPLGAKEFGVTVAIPDPPMLALDVLRARLTKAGVKILKQNSSTSPNEARVILVKRASAPLPDIIDHLHRVSDNLESQCFFLTMGKRQNVDPVQLLQKYWEKAGVSCVGWRLLDGSGLARANMIRPLDLAKINWTARHAATGDRYYQSLNLSKDGHSRAKLGAMSGVKTEVGFLRMPDGRELTFAVMANGLNPSVNFWRLKNALLEAIRNSGV